jgi:hypothetical protein
MTMQFSRRHLIGASAAALALVGAGCSGNATQDLATAAQDAITIANGLQGVLVQLATVPGMSAGVLAQIGVYVSDIKAAAASLQAASSTAAPGLVSQIEAAVNAVISAAAALPLPPPISTALQAAAILLPIIETAVGMIVQPSPAPAAASLKALPPMTPEQAIAALNAIAATVQH